ncbi:hypothetical protein [Pseudomonas phage phi176]|uniref:Uncharacterized protein n=1 Tax=Pseudomonas phage phi176 TaxID=1541891 RepID=A0A0A7NRK8_9CAUD|nr:hypothetical protein [Pseudomonas phage phi176]
MTISARQIRWIAEVLLFAIIAFYAYNKGFVKAESKTNAEWELRMMQAERTAEENKKAIEQSLLEAMNEVKKMLMNNWLIKLPALLLLMLSLVACGSKSPVYVTTSSPMMPELPLSGMQATLPLWCSPTCTEAVSAIDKNSQERLTEAMRQD